jgi:hypothetical protein
MTVRFALWTLDVLDVERMLRFWVGGTGLRHRRRPSSTPARRRAGLTDRMAAAHGRRQARKLRGHVDLFVVADGDVATEVDRLIALGASRAYVGQNGEEGVVVLADPEGNEFCILHRRWRH